MTAERPGQEQARQEAQLRERAEQYDSRAPGGSVGISRLPIFPFLGFPRAPTVPFWESLGISRLPIVPYVGSLGIHWAHGIPFLESLGLLLFPFWNT